MIDQSIHKRRIIVDARPKITCGKKNPNGQPMKLNYFNIEAYPELCEEYGDTPAKLIICLPSNEVSEVLQYDFARYGKPAGATKGIKTRVCDGVKCVHRKAEVVLGVKYEAGQESDCVCKDLDPDIDDQKKLMCRADVYLKAFVFSPKRKLYDNPHCMLFATTSANSGDAILSELENIKQVMGGRLIGIPFLLSVKMVERLTERGKESYPLWHLQALGTITQNHAMLEGMEKSKRLLPEPESFSIDESALKETDAHQVIEVEYTVIEDPDGEAPTAAEETVKAKPLDTATGGSLFSVPPADILDSELADIARSREKAKLMSWKQINQKRIDALPADRRAKLLQMFQTEFNLSK